MELSQFDRLVAEHLEAIIAFSRSLSDRESREFPQLAYLRHLHGAGILDIRYDSTTSPRTLAGDSGRFAVERVQGGKRLLKLSRSFRGQWLDMQEFLGLSDGEIADALDNFLLHELFHIKQNLTTARHGDIRQAPAVLRAADYHADANAAISAFLMYSFGDDFDANRWPEVYSRAVKAVLRQMYVFNFPTIRGDAILPSRLIRYMTWHYQYHRLRLYNPKANYKDVHLMFEPAISLRNIRGTRTITRNWAKDESSESASNSPQLWLTAPNDFGVACIFRHSAKDARHYDQLFLGMFDCNTEQTSHFFDDLFEENEELIGFRFSAGGGGGDGDDGGKGGGGNRPPPDDGGPSGPGDDDAQAASPDALPEVLTFAKVTPSIHRYMPIAEVVGNLTLFNETGIGLGFGDIVTVPGQHEQGRPSTNGTQDESET